ncbi:uncharacterized protein LOC109820285 [Asparagus officinalis]|uniref:uncharacterized protein LOC109820285 n=1 Tax=Asparagus officinalis TaxID=4686 RepID=UPI00098E7621|nr:uncharacterized protein LOC109820285 [Asparagus officinalis]XP_020242002.1 uncharacterized protein LOC109820285 [Asparagus officinalis]XP_020242003.1 uncharacterized protein LOC109820285 [Asparagus officinalis]
MENEHTIKSDKGSLSELSSPEDSPRGSGVGGKEENRLLGEMESLTVDKINHENRSETEREISESLNEIGHSKEEVLIADKENKESDSESENQNDMSVALETERNSGLDTDSPNEKRRSSEKTLVEEKESDSETEEPSEISQKADKVEEEIGSDLDKFRTLSNNAMEEESDSVTERLHNMSHTATEVPVIDKEIGSDSENMSRNTQTTDKLEDSDSDYEDPNKRSVVREEVHILEKEIGKDFENVNEESQSPMIVKERNSDSMSPKENNHTTSECMNNGSDSNNPNEKIQSSEEVEKDGDSDSETLNKTITMSTTTREVLIEEEIGLTSENNASQTEEDVIEVKEVDPVFDGTEAPEAGTGRTLSSQSLDLYPDSPTSSWPEKAAALKNLVKMKGAVAVSTVLRRLSGGKDDGGNPDEEEKNVIMESSVEEPVMKGRIILYTKLGCQESREIRSFMHQRGLKFIEINVDIYPSRKLELEMKTGSSAIPRVYLNDFVVGGLTELESMDESGKFAEQLKALAHEEPSDEAPLPPFPGEDDVSATGKIDELASIVKKMKESIVLSDRFSKLRKFNNCFLGSEAVDFLSRDQDLEREEAVNLGRKLVKGLFFRQVLDENIFEDGNYLYRFLEHDPLISTNCYNMTRGVNELKPKRVTEIASRLRFVSFAIFEAYVSEDGRHVDYKSIHGCEEFRRYLRIIEELQRVELDNISREEKLAFFINLYNMMAIHAILTWGYPNSAADRKKFLGEFKYVVGGCPYSLSAIQNGVLRGNQRPPYNISKPFGARDMRFKVALPYVEPLIHFALVSGNVSGPPLRCYSPGNIDMELMESARNFLRNGGLLVDAETKTASASSIIRWYSVDFGKNEAEVMKHLSNYLEPSKSQDLLDLLANNQLRVTYQPYDWGPNC